MEEAYGFVVALDGPWQERFVREPAADAVDSLVVRGAGSVGV